MIISTFDLPHDYCYLPIFLHGMFWRHCAGTEIAIKSV